MQTRPEDNTSWKAVTEEKDQTAGRSHYKFIYPSVILFS